MYNGKTKYEVSDPAFYDSLIAEQKKRVRQHPQDAEQWLELGRLCEAKIDMTNYFAGRNFWVRNFLTITTLLVFGTIVFLYFKSPFTRFMSWKFLLFAFFIYVCFLVWGWFLRYPPSGIKYFKKAVQLDPKCGDAYMYLGLICAQKLSKTKWMQVARAGRAFGCKQQKED